MRLFSELEQKRAANSKAMAAFGAKVSGLVASLHTFREGTKVTLYTIGYERRDGEGLMSILRDQGIKAIADVRARPMSRKPDFRATALRELCESSGIKYQSWPMLGSTDAQREDLQDSGDFQKFEKDFEAFAKKTMTSDLKCLAESVARIPTALLCYERLHTECHRSVIARMVAEEIDATIIAIQ